MDSAQFPHSPKPPPAVSRRIRAQVLADMRPLKRRCVWRLGLASTLAALAALGVAVALPLLQEQSPLPHQWVMAGGGLLLAVGTAWLGLVLGRHRRWLKTVSLALPLVGYLALVFAGRAVSPAETPFHPIGGCLGLAGLIATVPLVALLMLWRRTDGLSPSTSAALVGSVAGLVGAGGLSLACPSVDWAHLLLAHGTLVAVLAAVGGSALSRWLAP